MENFLEVNYENNIKSLNSAFDYCNQSFTHDEIISVLSSDDDLKKQLCILNLDCVLNQNEADILVYNLTRHSGPIRESASYKILDLISNPSFTHFFQSKTIIDTFVNSVSDINPSVSRNAVNIIKYVNDFDYMYSVLINNINAILDKQDEDLKQKSYLKNKKNFALYWNLEAIISISDKLTPKNELYEILAKTALSNDYTIREKTAKAAFIFSVKNNLFLQISDLLKYDLNIYVKNYVMV